MEFSFNEFKKRIALSNQSAAGNRNYYPIQEQASLTDIWEYVTCDCADHCICKQYGCTHHWKLKDGLEFDEVVKAFIRMFVDTAQHETLLRYIGSGEMNQAAPRIKGSLGALTYLKENWELLYKNAVEHNKTIICDDWNNSFFKNEWQFDYQNTTIYMAKLYSMLLPDVALAYDTASRKDIKQILKSGEKSYMAVLTAIRSKTLNMLQNERENISNLRRLDSPTDQLPFDPGLISLAINGRHYGDGYYPLERPLSRIIDKYFYMPVRSDNTDNQQVEEIWAEREYRRNDIYPLSGSGKLISLSECPGGRRVTWGDIRFDLLDKKIKDILNIYFQGDKWYALGASMTAPTPGGLGEYVRNQYAAFTPRHASAIAAIMVNDGLLEFTQEARKVMLRKRIKGGVNDEQIR